MTISFRDPRPTIRLERNHFSEIADFSKIADQVARLLIAADQRVYRGADGRLIFCWNWQHRDKTYVQVERLLIPRMQVLIERVAKFEKHDPHRDKWIPADCPATLAGLVIRGRKFPAYDEAADAVKFSALLGGAP